MTQEALEHFFAFKRHDTWSDAALPDDASFEGSVEFDGAEEFESVMEDATEDRGLPKTGGSR